MGPAPTSAGTWTAVSSPSGSLSASLARGRIIGAEMTTTTVVLVMIRAVGLHTFMVPGMVMMMVMMMAMMVGTVVDVSSAASTTTSASSV